MFTSYRTWRGRFISYTIYSPKKSDVFHLLWESHVRSIRRGFHRFIHSRVVAYNAKHDRKTFKSCPGAKGVCCVHLWAAASVFGSGGIKNNECWLWQCEKQILPALFTFSRELECGKFDHHQLLRKTWAGLVLQIVQQNIPNESLFWPDVKMCRTSKMWNQAASADKRENISLFLRFYVALFSLAREIRNLFGIDICCADVTDLVHHDLATALIDQ